MELATFGGGCFWGVEEVFRTQSGVKKTSVGYMGGTTHNPTYEQVCTGKTGHAEVVHIEFDPNTISYESLLSLFFDNHNPTELNRQGPDVGLQYRSIIFAHSDVQEKSAQSYIQKLSGEQRFKRPIVTVITKAKDFWIAEDYHQQYLNKRGMTACHI